MKSGTRKWLCGPMKQASSTKVLEGSSRVTGHSVMTYVMTSITHSQIDLHTVRSAAAHYRRNI